MQLTPEQITHFRDEGYVFVGKLLNDAMLAAIRAEEARFRGTPGPNERTLFRSQLCHHSTVLRQLATAGPQLDWLPQLIGPNVALWFNQYVTKFPDSDHVAGEFPWHQDSGYAPIDPATSVTIWIALDDVDERNGCVWVMPRSHAKGLLPHRSKSADSWHLTLDVEGDGVPARLKAGEAVAFTGQTLHRSKHNQTDRPRRALFLEYTDAEATYTKRADNTKTPVVLSGQSWVVCGQMDWPAKLNMTIFR